MLKTQDYAARERRETYLSGVSHSLEQYLGPLDLYESIQELRAHIDSMTAAYLELGADPEAAMIAALRKFGPAEVVGAGYAPQPTGIFKISESLRFVIVMSGAVSLGALTLFGIDLWYALSRGQHGFFGPNTVMGAAFGLPIGMLAWFSRVKPVKFGLQTALLVELFLTLTLYLILFNTRQQAQLPALLLVTSLAAFLVGSATAWMVQRLRGSGPAKAMYARR